MCFCFFFFNSWRMLNSIIELVWKATLSSRNSEDMSRCRVSLILFPLSLPGLMKKEAALKERNKLRMREYCAQLSEKKNVIKLYDHNRKWEKDL